MKKVAWIIGGTSGIGLETALRLKAHVDEVVVLGRSAGHIASARQRLGKAVAVEKIDLYDWQQVDSLCQRLENLPDRIQYLVNAAGTFVPKPFLDHHVEDYDKYMALNRSLYFVTQAAARNMKTKRRRRDRQRRLDVGAPGDQGDALLRILDGQSGAPRVDPASGDGAR